jgi:preprotein translocase subunit SecF
MNPYASCAVWFIFGFLVGVISTCLIMVRAFPYLIRKRDSVQKDKNKL